MAVREAFRAVVRQLEERGALDHRPGRTADEAARDAGTVFESLRLDLGQAAGTFDEVAYGERPGSAHEYRADPRPRSRHSLRRFGGPVMQRGRDVG